MRIEDYVAKSINDHPFLYYGPSYERAKFSVLHQAFIVLGNGLGWAHTEIPSEGGYLTEGTFYKDDEDEWVRGYDPAYGTVTVELDSRFWKEEMYCLSKIKSAFQESEWGTFVTPDIHTTENLFESEVKSRGILQKPHVFIDCLDAVCGVVSEKEYDSSIHTHILRKIDRTRKTEIKNYNPYSNFSKRFSCFWEIEPALIQEDWLVEGVAHLKHWEKYFSDPERYKYYPGFSTTEEFKAYIEECIMERHPESWIDQIRSEDGEHGYGFKGFDGKNYEQLTELKNYQTLEKARRFINETLKRLGR
jgi:hypothetical protein